MNNEIKFIERGWECPKCGAVMAPHMNVCINCKGDSGYGLATTQPSLDKWFLHPNPATTDATKPYTQEFECDGRCLNCDNLHEVRDCAMKEE